MNIYLPSKIKPLAGHVSSETAYIVESYPYGGYRTHKKYWVEFHPKHGQRVVTRTLDPKRGIWNNPHAGTYSQVICLFINEENGHVEHSHLHHWQTKDEFDLFEAAFNSVLTEQQRKDIQALRVLNIRQSPLTYFGLNSDEKEVYEAGLKKIAEDIPMPEDCKLNDTDRAEGRDLSPEVRARRKAIFEQRQAARDVLIETIKGKRAKA
jgi:hypothetical protein